MQLINAAINLILTWSGNCNIYSNAAANHSLTLAITDTKLYALFVTLPTDDNAKLSQHSILQHDSYEQLAGANINQKQNFIDPSILGVNRLFVLPFENNM